MALSGKGALIKEYTIAVEVFGRSPQFDQNSESAVRVEAHRLRKRLEKYYEQDGAANPVRIELPVGHYVPRFVPRPEPQPVVREVVTRRPGWLLATAGGLFAVVAAAWFLTSRRTVEATVHAPHILTDSAVRILAGYPKEQFRDRFGNQWLGDRYFSGGAAERSGDYAGTTTIRFLRAATDLGLFQYFRAGDFSYDIPLQPGVYEMRLHFAETGFGPCVIAGGGENSRVFDILLNGKRIVEAFDAYTNAGDCMTATVMSFKDVRVAADGRVHLAFKPVRDRPFVNAIELVPGVEGRMLPVRMIAGEHSYTDSKGQIWSPDSYFVNGRIAANAGTVKGTSDPDLYANERYGNFKYVIPVPPGRYSVTLHFAETHFGPSHPRKIGGAGSRVFDVLLNGAVLMRDFDVFKAAGGDFRAFFVTFKGLEPSPQGTLALSFVPVSNYASVRAIEVVAE